MTTRELPLQDIAVQDTAASDSMAGVATEEGMVFTSVSRPVEVAERKEDFSSWILLGLLLMFVAVCLRVKSNIRYLQVLVKDLTEVRERHNAFDETVRETSLLVLLNIFWSCCAGVLLYALLHLWGVQGAGESMAAVKSGELTMLLCMGVMLCYTVVMIAAYWVVGNVFSDALHARMWVKGFAAEQGLSVVLMFPLALGVLLYPESTEGLLIAAGITFVTGKLIFIVKGFRIFFTQIASWVLFLYYLCSLEIVPLILIYLLADICSRML